jgi:UDPglucose 6-dehydrogenase
MTIGIVGTGFVGSALLDTFGKHFAVVAYDKESDWHFAGDQKNKARIWTASISWADKLVRPMDGPIFVCVPTPMLPDGRCNRSIVLEVLNALDVAAEKVGRIVDVVIKSTVPPGTTEGWQATMGYLNLCFNPEFLRERYAAEDFANQSRVVLGGEREVTERVAEVYKVAMPEAVVVHTDATTAELVKYATNCFLAAKVSIANEFAQVCDKLGVNYDAMIRLAQLDKRLGNTHWDVPGHDCHWGFGGSCFPKDINAFIHVAESLGITPHTLKGAWETNLTVRPERDWEELKGRAVT